MRTFPSSAFKNLYYAHRGLYDNSAGVPENSLAAFRAAAEKGYGVELDVQVTKDGQVIVFHDDTLDRLCGVSGFIWDRTLAELQQLRLLDTEEAIPLFSDVLSVLAQGAGPVIVELKHGPRNRELCEKTWALLQGYKGVYCIESFDPMIVFWFRRHAPQVFRGQLSEPAADYPEIRDPVLARLLGGCRFSLLNKPDFYAYKLGPRPKKVLRAREKGILLVGWSSRDAEKDAADNDAVIFEYCAPPLRYK